MNTNKLLFRLKIFILFLGLFLLSCKDNDVNAPLVTPPDVPPISTFKMDFNDFPLSAQFLKNNGAKSYDEIMTQANWGWASFNVVVWQTIVTTGMIVPVASFVESFNHQPVKQEDGRWAWTYEFTPYTGIKHTASLYADVGTSSVNWEMYISKENQFNDFLWYSGQSDLLATGGTWTIFAEPANPTPWIGIVWNRNPIDSTGDIKYTNIKPNDGENGGYIFYGVTTDDPYDVFYEIFNKGKDNTISIKWNKDSHIGSVRDSSHFDNFEWYCWDENHEDIDCP